MARFVLHAHYRGQCAARRSRIQRDEAHYGLVSAKRQRDSWRCSRPSRRWGRRSGTTTAGERRARVCTSCDGSVRSNAERCKSTGGELLDGKSSEECCSNSGNQILTVREYSHEEKNPTVSDVVWASGAIALRAPEACLNADGLRPWTGQTSHSTRRHGGGRPSVR
jgi:hypothetical protein